MSDLIPLLDGFEAAHDLILTCLNVHGDKIAIIDADNESEQISYSEIVKSGFKIANFLIDEIQLKKQETIAALLHNCWEFYSIHFGTSIAGGIFTAISSHFTNYEISHQLRNSDSVVVFVDANYLKKVLAVLPECPKIRKIIVLGKFVKTNSPIEILPFNHLNNFSNEQPTNLPEINPEDVFWLPYSSGTTGLPKGVMITHKNYLNHFKSYVIHGTQIIQKNYDLADVQYTIAFMPIYHAMGYTGSITGLIKGQTTVLMKKYTLERLLQLIEKYKPNFIGSAPVIAQQMAKLPVTKKYDVSSVKWISSGGGKLDEGTIKTLYKAFPSIEFISQGYGMTEAVTVLTLTRAMKSDPSDSVGLPLPGVEIKIVDPETEKHLPIGKLGEIRFKAPYTMKGYWKNPEATRACYDKNGYFKTGDIGFIDKDGLLHIQDRIKELIKVKAFQVPPAELEEVLMTHPKISDCAVIGIPHDSDGEVPKAFIVRSTKTLTADEVKKFIADRLSYYKHLKGGVEFVEEIPRTASGKIMRRYFKEREALHHKSKL